MGHFASKAATISLCQGSHSYVGAGGRGGTEEKTAQLSLNAGSTKGAPSKKNKTLKTYRSALNWDLKSNFLLYCTWNHKAFSETGMHPDNLKNKSWSQARERSKILINMPRSPGYFTKYIHLTAWRMAGWGNGSAWPKAWSVYGWCSALTAPAM